MRWIDNARVGVKLTILSAIALVGVALIAAMGLFTAYALQADVGRLIDAKLMPEQSIGEARAALGAISASWARLATNIDPGRVESTKVYIEQMDQATQKSIDGVNAAGTSAELQEVLQGFEGTWQEYRNDSAAIWKDYQQNGVSALATYKIDNLQVTITTADATLRRVNDLMAQDVTAARAGVAQRTQLALLALIGMSLVCAAGLLVVSRLVRRSVVTPLKALIGAAQRLGAGDLRQELKPSARKDEVGELEGSFARMAGDLRGLLQELTHSGGLVADAAEKMLATAEQASTSAADLTVAFQSVAEGAEGQNQAASDAAEAIAQLREAIAQVTGGAEAQAGYAGETSRLADQAGSAVQAMSSRMEALLTGARTSARAAEESIDTVQQAVGGMDRLAARVEETAGAVRLLDAETVRIEDVVNLIREIANQTNLLALNAAIEAARAGESGRGFAVVAEEVRKLADRSATSAGEISALLQTVRGHVSTVVTAMESGSREAADSARHTETAGRALHEIVDSVRSTVAEIDVLRSSAGAVIESTAATVTAINQVAAVVQENTAATASMAHHSDQVGESVGLIAEVAGTTAGTAESVAASVEELSAATEEVTETARSLAEVADQLKAKVMRFKV